jgi:hypothetical protein
MVQIQSKQQRGYIANVLVNSILDVLIATMKYKGSRSITVFIQSHTSVHRFLMNENSALYFGSLAESRMLKPTNLRSKRAGWL